MAIMKHDVFISYSSKNSAVAELILDELSKASIKCWMAPQSLNGGDEYEEIIDEAIRACRVFVLVFSETAMSSRWVNSELTIAFNEYKHIIPFKVDQSILQGKMKVKLIQSHWINAYPEVTAKINELVRSIQSTLNAVDANAVAAEKDESAKVLSFVQRFELEDAQDLFRQKKYAEAIDLALPLGIKGNLESQSLLCKIYYYLSNPQMDADLIRSINPKIKDTIEAVAETGSDWANFILHCYAYKQNDHAASLAYLKKAVRGDSIGLAFVRLGIVYGWGLGVDVNRDHALKCFQKAEELGCIEACSYLGQHFKWGGKGIIPDKEKAIDYFLKGVEAKDMRSIRLLINFYSNDREGLENVDRLLEKMSNEETDGIEYLYGIYYLNKYYLDSDGWFKEEENKEQAVSFLEVAMNNGDYLACGSLARLYYDTDPKKARDYAEKGYQHGDGFSYYLLALIEQNEGNFARSWEIAEERFNRFGVGAEVLGNLFLEKNYLPTEDYLPILVRLLATNADIGDIDSCKVLITLYSDQKYGMVDQDKEEYYRHLAATFGETTEDKNQGVTAILDYASFLLQKDTPHYNPLTAVSFLKKGIDRQSVEASRLLLEQYQEKETGYYKKMRDKAASYILKAKAYFSENESDRYYIMYDSLMKISPTKENAESVKIFLLDLRSTILNNQEDRSAVWKRKKAGHQLIKGALEGYWTLEDEDNSSIMKELEEQLNDSPGVFFELRDHAIQLYPDYDSETGRRDFGNGTDSLNARLYYAFNLSFKSEIRVKEQDLTLSALLDPVRKDPCYRTILSQDNGALVGAHNLWEVALKELADIYPKICSERRITPVTNLHRCPYSSIVPFFPRELALSFYRKTIRAVISVAQKTGHTQILTLLNKDEELLDYIEESVTDENLQLFFVEYVELMFEVKNLLREGERILSALEDLRYEDMAKYIASFIKQLDDAKITHNLTVPTQEQLAGIKKSLERISQGD